MIFRPKSYKIVTKVMGHFRGQKVAKSGQKVDFEALKGIFVHKMFTDFGTLLGFGTLSGHFLPTF